MNNGLLETSKNIRTVNKCAKELTQTLEAYRLENERIQSRSNIYTQAVLDKDLQRNKYECTAKMKKIAEQGLNAVRFLRDNTELKSQKLDLSDKQLMTTLSLIKDIGSNLEYNEICDMIDGFKGNIPALRLIGKTLTSSGNTYAARYCSELCNMPSEFDYDEVVRAFLAVVYGSEAWENWKSPWNIKNINDMGKRLDIDIDSNPYIEQLRQLCAKSGGDDIARKALAEGLRVTESTLEETTETDKRLDYIVNSATDTINELAAAKKYNDEHMNVV